MQRPAERRHRDAALFRRGDVHGPDGRSRAVDGHRGGDFIERDALEEDLHVGQRRDRHTALAELAERHWVVVVVAVERRHVKGDRESRLPLLQQVAEAHVGLLGGAEAREHTHRPGLGAIHRRLHAARVGILAGEAEIAVVVELRSIRGRIQALDGHARLRGEVGVSLGHTPGRAGNVGRLPLRVLRGNVGERVGIVERTGGWLTLSGRMAVHIRLAGRLVRAGLLFEHTGNLLSRRRIANPFIELTTVAS